MTVLAMATTTGAVKEINQDACCYKEAETPFGWVRMCIVCDGVGGWDAGEVASSTLISRFCDWFDKGLPRFVSGLARENSEEGSLDLEAASAAWAGLLQQANTHLRAYAEATGAPLATTFTGLFSCERRYLVMQVGIARAWEVTEAGCRQLTEDQSLVSQMVSTGVLSAEEAESHPRRNVILQAIGAQEEVRPVTSWGAFSDDAVYAVGCDGFYAQLSTDEIAEALGGEARSDDVSLQRACDDLVARCLQRGERDNITVVAFDPGMEDAGGTVVLDAPAFDEEDASSTILLEGRA